MGTALSRAMPTIAPARVLAGRATMPSARRSGAGPGLGAHGVDVLAGAVGRPALVSWCADPLAPAAVGRRPCLRPHAALGTRGRANRGDGRAPRRPDGRLRSVRCESVGLTTQPRSAVPARDPCSSGDRDGYDAAAARGVLAHELAHIRRHDYAVNVGQMMGRHCSSTTRPSGGSRDGSGSNASCAATMRRSGVR